MVKPIYIIATAGILTGLVMFMGNKVNVKGKRVAVIGDSHSALYGEGWQEVAAGSFISLALPLIVFFALQRYFVRGLTAGAVK